MIIQWGLLWYDGASWRTLEEKVGAARERYIEKYGSNPNVCFVHPSATNEDAVQVEGCRVVPNPTVLKHHFWIGEAKE